MLHFGHWIWHDFPVVNSADEEKTLALNAKGYRTAEIHLTDGTHDLEQVPIESYVSGGQAKLPAKRVMTLVMNSTSYEAVPSRPGGYRQAEAASSSICVRCLGLLF